MEEPPTDYYYDRLSEDLRSRHPQADSHLIDHLVSLEAFLDKSISPSASTKAEVVVAEGKAPWPHDEERCQAVVDFPPCAKSCISNSSWAARTGCGATCPQEYGHAAKVLGQWQRPGAESLRAACGLGAGATAGMQGLQGHQADDAEHICLASFDEAAAAMGRAPSSR